MYWMVGGTVFKTEVQEALQVEIFNLKSRTRQNNLAWKHVINHILVISDVNIWAFTHWEAFSGVHKTEILSR